MGGAADLNCSDQRRGASMNNGQPSKTAMMMAILRAHHLLTAPEPRILDDSLAMQLAGLKSAEEVHAFYGRITSLFAGFAGSDAAERTAQRMAMTTCVRS